MIERFTNRTDFTDYDDFRQNFRLIIPENFNFAYDVVDAWAAEEPDREALLWTNPAVVECAITAVPDEIRGQIVKATIVLAKDYVRLAGADLVRDIQDHVKRITAPYKYPRVIEFVKELPKTISGKIRRVAIRATDAANSAASSIADAANSAASSIADAANSAAATGKKAGGRHNTPGATPAFQ